MSAEKGEADTDTLTNITNDPADDEDPAWQQPNVKRYKQGIFPFDDSKPKWESDPYDHYFATAQGLATSNNTQIISSNDDVTLELVVDSQTFSITLTSSQNNLIGLKNTINQHFKKTAKKDVAEIKQSPTDGLYYLRIEIVPSNTDILALRTIPGDSSTNILQPIPVHTPGCLLTSLSMALNFAGIENDPGTLNQFMIMRNLDTNGWASTYYGSLVNLGPTTKEASKAMSPFVKSIRVPLKYDPLVSGSMSPVELEYVLITGFPVIVRVPSPVSGGSHFVLVTGKLNGKFQIADPGFNKTTLDEYSTFTIAGFVGDPPNNSELDIAVGDEAELIVTDQNGKRSGFDLTSGSIVEEIPASAYFRLDVGDDVPPGLISETARFVHIARPAEGNYQIIVRGLKSGSYALSIRAFSQDGSDQPPILLTGDTGPGSTSTFQLQFASSPGSVSQVVEPNKPPAANAGSDQTVECTGLVGTQVKLDGTGSTDPDGDALTFIWTGPFGTVSGPTPTVFLPLGTHTITLTVDDGKGGTASDQVVVIVKDTTPPVSNLTSLPNVTAECSAQITTTPTATDNCAGSVTGTTTDPLSYTQQGTFTVTWTFSDGNGNSSTQTQTVIVKDVTPPVPDLASLPTVTGECSAAISSSPTATDNCARKINGTTADPLNYATQGTFTVTWAFSDGNGNASTQPQTVVVKDVTPPSINNVAASPNLLWPPNHTMVPVSVAVSAMDNCSATAECHIASVSSNEPINGLGDGDTAPDWEITGNLRVNLRAERSGTGNGRVYTITVGCTDALGNSSTGTATVTVPHDQGKKQ